MEQVYLQSDSLNLGIETTPELDGPWPSLRVTWIRWDSGFRNSGLRVRDRIVAIDGKPVTRPRNRAEEQEFRLRAIGQYLERQLWQDAGRKDGDEVVLTVRRRAIPGRGWSEHALRGRVLLDRSYRNDQNRVLLGSGGPDYLSNDGFSDTWSSWCDAARRSFAQVLDESWLHMSQSSKYSLEQHRQFEERSRLLATRYPGLFSRAVVDDWEEVSTALIGRKWALTDEDLRYRRLSAERVAEIAAAGRAAREAFLAARAAETIPPFPSIDPILGDRSQVAGKVVVLPEITNRSWISQGTRTAFIVSEGNSFYTIDAEGDAMQRALLARFRYQLNVSGDLADRFAIIGRILPDPAQVVIGDRGYFALKVEPLGVSIGDAMFVDVSLPERGPEPDFAGEQRVVQSGLRRPPDDASPEDVMTTFFSALKLGDRALWRTLFASFNVYFTDSGVPIIEPSWGINEESTWSDARNQLERQVYDVRIVWCDDPRPVVTGREFEGAPTVDETTAIIEHVGRADDGTFHSFVNVGLRRLWTLRRINHGPWRIAEQFGI